MPCDHCPAVHRIIHTGSWSLVHCFPHEVCVCVCVCVVAWGLGILVSAPCPAERRQLASDMPRLSCLMTKLTQPTTLCAVHRKLCVGVCESALTLVSTNSNAT